MTEMSRKEQIITLIIIFVIATMLQFLLVGIRSSRANDLYDCPGKAAVFDVDADPFALTVHYPHVWQWYDGPGQATLGTETLTIEGAEGARVEAGTVCAWRVWLTVYNEMER